MPDRASARPSVSAWPATALALALLALGLPVPTGAQEEAGVDDSERPLSLEVEPATGRLTLRLGPVLDDGGIRRAIHSGLPVRIRVRVELWSDGFFDGQEGEAQWRATVVQDPLDRSYRVETSSGDGPRTVPSLQGAAYLLGRAFEVPLRPDRDGSYYYLAFLEVETLSLSDLEELQRWLRGDLAPAVSGEEEVETALGRGMRRLVVRVLGLPTRRYRVRSPTFEADPGSAEAVPDTVGPGPPPLLPDCPPGAGRQLSKTARRTVSSSIRASSGTTPMPGPAGSVICPSAISNSGSTMSRSQ